MCNIPHDINISYVVHFAKKKSFLGFRWKNKNRMNLIHFGFFSENLLQLFWLHCEHMKIMYVNCGLRNEYESDPAPSWLVSSVDRTLHRYRKGEKEKKRKHCLHITILSLSIYLHSSNADRNNDSFLRLSVFLPCTDVIKCLTEYWTGDIMKRICRSLLKMESTFLPLTIHLISISQRLHDQLRNGIVTLQSNVITKAIFMVYIHTRLLHEQKMQGLVLNV